MADHKEYLPPTHYKYSKTDNAIANSAIIQSMYHCMAYLKLILSLFCDL